MIIRIINACRSMLRSSERMQGRSWATEMFARAMKSLFVDANGKSVHWLREQLDSASVVHPAMAKVSMSTREIAGVSCLMVSPKRSRGALGRSDNKPETVIVYFHGGGYVCGSPKGYQVIIAQLAASLNCLVVAVDYRLAPEYSFPTPQDDCLTVTKAVIKTYPEHKIVLVGDSAGGALAVSTALALATTPSTATSDSSDLSGLVLLSPWVEPTADGGTIKTNGANDFLFEPLLGMSYAALMQDNDYRNPRVNLAHATLSSMPKTLVQCGTGELLYDQIKTFSERAIKADVDLTLHSYNAQFHVFQMVPVLSDARQAMAEIVDFIKRL